MQNKTAALCAVGCKVSKYETDVMAQCLKEAGYSIVNFDEKASVYVVNTCTVTNIGDRKSRQLIRRAKSRNKDAIVVAAGCYSQISPEEASNINGVNIVIGTSGHTKIVEIIENYRNNYLTTCNNGAINPQIIVSGADKAEKYEHAKITEQQNRIRAYVKIEDGCDNFCSYCIIPYARGRVKSRDKDEILQEIKTLCDNGVNEIVLTGIHVASYGKDLQNTTLLTLLESICDIKELKRLRLSSLEPKIINSRFLEVVSQYNCFCDFFHLSLQSGSEKTLKTMNRKYTAQMYKEAVSLIYNTFPNASVWSDVIVGFPGETNDDFEQSYQFIKHSGIVKLHIFPFSPKKGTKAYEMEEQVNNKDKYERASALRELNKCLYNAFLYKNIGLKHYVLFERRDKDGYYVGHTKNYILVKTHCETNIINKIIPTELDCVCGDGVVLGKV